MEVGSESSACSKDVCILLHATPGAAEESVVDAIRSRGWIARSHDDALLALADLLVVERETTSRAAWGLPVAVRSHLVIAGPAPNERLVELRDLCAASRRYAPRATIWVFESDEMRSVHAGVDVNPPAPIAPPIQATPLPSVQRDLRLTPGEPAPFDGGEAGRLSSAELDMLFGDEGTRGTGA